jgi:3-dehydrosphinganine reductase
MAMNINDQVAVITGGSSGLGLELARRMRRAGAKVAIVARDPGRLAAARAELAALSGGPLAAFSCDVSDPAATQKTFAAIAAELGPPALLVCSAGVLRENPFEREDLAVFRQLMDINFFGALHSISAALPFFTTRGSGRIVVVSSMAGLMGVYGYAAYCSSKYALTGLCETLRQELAPRNIGVQIVHPPEFESPMVAELEKCRSPENRFLVRTGPVLSIAQVADAVMRGLDRGGFRIIPDFQSRSLDRLNRWWPGLGRAIVDLQLRRCRRKFGTVTN